jgi:hypothetical protein
MHHNWAFSWPANRRVMYNRASADAEGNPWDATRAGIKWNGEKWVGDVPDMKPDAPPGTFCAFIMLPEGVGKLFAPFTTVRSPSTTKRSKRRSTTRPASGGDVQPGDRALQVGQGRVRHEGPSIDRLHDLSPDRALPLLDAAPAERRLNELQPGFFVEIPRARASRKGIANGSQVQVISAAARSRASAMVTKRLRPLKVDGKETLADRVPDPLGFAGDPEHTGPLANLLTPSAMDPNTWTPEYKAFLVKLEKA